MEIKGEPEGVCSVYNFHRRNLVSIQVPVQVTSDLSSDVWSCAGVGAAESSQGRQCGAGLRQGLPELHLWVYLQQLPGALQPPVPACCPACESPNISIFKVDTVADMDVKEIKTSQYYPLENLRRQFLFIPIWGITFKLVYLTVKLLEFSIPACAWLIGLVYGTGTNWLGPDRHRAITQRCPWCSFCRSLESVHFCLYTRLFTFLQWDIVSLYWSEVCVWLRSSFFKQKIHWLRKKIWSWFVICQNDSLLFCFP